MSIWLLLLFTIYCNSIRCLLVNIHESQKGSRKCLSTWRIMRLLLKYSLEEKIFTVNAALNPWNDWYLSRTFLEQNIQAQVMVLEVTDYKRKKIPFYDVKEMVGVDVDSKMHILPWLKTSLAWRQQYYGTKTVFPATQPRRCWCFAKLIWLIFWQHHFW